MQDQGAVGQCGIQDQDWFGRRFALDVPTGSNGGSGPAENLTRPVKFDYRKY